MPGVLLPSCFAEGTRISWETIDPPFSLFKFRAKHGWTTTALHRLFSQWRQNGVRSIVIEKIDPFPEVEKEDEAFRRVQPNTFRGSDLYRLTAFNQPRPSNASIDALPAQACAGFCIIKENRFSRGDPVKPVIFESVSPPSLHSNAFSTCAHEYGSRVQGRAFYSRGLYYCQQNGTTNNCVHASLKMLCHGRDPSMPIKYHEIDSTLKTDLIGPADLRGGSRKGLSTSHIEQFLDAQGIHYSQHVYRELGGRYRTSKFPYYKYLYASIEMGCPALMVFRSSNQARHVITVLGHTFNEDAYRPLAETGYHRLSKRVGYIPSEQWMSDLIVHDDNFGGEHCLPTHYFNQFRVGYVLGTLPNAALWDPKEAELAGLGYLNSCLEVIENPLGNTDPWCKRLVPAMKSHSVAIRTIVMQKEAYLRHLTTPEQPNPAWPVEKARGEFTRYIRTHFPNTFYALEFSLPDLYSANRRKLGEVLLKCDKIYATSLNFDSILGIRAPSYFFEPKGKKLWPTMLTGISNHLPLYSGRGSTPIAHED